MIKCLEREEKDNPLYIHQYHRINGDQNNAIEIENNYDIKF